MKNLHFINGGTSEINIEKEGRKWVYFMAKTTGIRYRVDKESGEVQVAPYWSTIKGIYVTD